MGIEHHDDRMRLTYSRINKDFRVLDGINQNIKRVGYEIRHVIRGLDHVGTNWV